MAQETYAKYIQAYPKDKKASAQLTSPNSIVGNKFKLLFNSKNPTIKIKNEFDYNVADLSEEDSKQIKLWHNKGLEVVALLSCVFYCEPESRHFAEFLILAYPRRENEAYENFVSRIGEALRLGNRPDISLDKFEREQILKSNGAYKFTKYLKAPKLEKGTVVLKNKQNFTEKLIEAGRHKKIGCYVGSILFILIIVGLIAWLVCQIIS